MTFVATKAEEQKSCSYHFEKSPFQKKQMRMKHRLREPDL
jgi:hypothetical protein